MTVSSVDDLRALIREVPDFPKPGIRFYDITTLLKQPDAFREVIDRMAEQVGDTPVDLVVDDLLATGGTVMGTIELVRRLGGEIAGLSFMVELSALNGRDKLGEFDIHTLLSY